MRSCFTQLEGIIGPLAALPGSSMPETASSLDHFCELLRHNVGCDVVGAVEDALINWWVSGVPVPNPSTARVDNWGAVEGGTQCSSALDLSNYQRQCSLTLLMNRDKYERPICTDHWQGRIQLCCCDNPEHRIEVQMQPTLPRLCINAMASLSRT